MVPPLPVAVPRYAVDAQVAAGLRDPSEECYGCNSDTDGDM